MFLFAPPLGGYGPGGGGAGLPYKPPHPGDTSADNGARASVMQAVIDQLRGVVSKTGVADAAAAYQRALDQGKTPEQANAIASGVAQRKQLLGSSWLFYGVAAVALGLAAWIAVRLLRRSS